MKRFLIALCLAFSVHMAFAGEAAPIAADPVAEKRLVKLSEQLRCLVCQNQNIADSNAELAQDLRREIRTMIKDGKSDKEIVDFMVARYGDFVLYKPPFNATTLFLWVGPIALMLVGLVALARHLKQRNRRLAESGDGGTLSEEDAKRAEALLNETKNS